MRFARALSAAAASVLLVLSGAASTARAEDPGGGYAALGDSYSSGVGAGDYLPDSAACERSRRAYPELWAATHHPSSFSFAACMGATTDSVANSQLRVLNRSTALVSLTVGGNDVGFADTMQACVLGGQAACGRAVASAEGLIEHQLPGRLDALFARIRAAAPTARVVVLGYPHLYKVPGACLYGLNDAERGALDTAGDQLDAALAAASQRSGFTFADVRAAFTGHEICSAAPWLHSATMPPTSSYHPTATGQSLGYLPVFARSAT